MKCINTSDIGYIIYWHDFIISNYYKDQDNQPVIEFKQSNTKLRGYSSRTIGIAKRAEGYAVGVALSKEDLTPKTEKSGKGVVIHRIKNLMSNSLSTTVKDKGITWVPDSYLTLLYNDPAAYNNLYGPMDPTTTKIAINMLNDV